MTPIVAIARNTFREAIRDRVFHSLLAFAVVVLMGSLLFSYVTVADELRIVHDVGLAAIHLFGVLVAIVLGTGLIYKEVAKRTVFTLLSKPLSRESFVVGKYLGLLGVLAVDVAAMTAVFYGLFVAKGGAVTILGLKAAWLIFVELAVITAFVLLCSGFATPFTSGLLSLLFFLSGHMIREVGTYLLNEKSSRYAARGFWEVVARVYPDLETFNLKEQALYGLQVGWGEVGLATVYGACWSLAFVVGACLLFRRREFV